MDDSKQEMVNHIRKWLILDSTISNMQTTIKEHKEQKKKLSESLVNIMKTSEIDCFDTKNGKLIYSQTKTKKAITKKSLLETLNNFFKDDAKLAQKVSEHVLNTREETIKENIRLKKEK
jgi:hypothetical protein